MGSTFLCFFIIVFVVPVATRSQPRSLLTEAEERPLWAMASRPPPPCPQADFESVATRSPKSFCPITNVFVLVPRLALRAAYVAAEIKIFGFEPSSVLNMQQRLLPVLKKFLLLFRNYIKGSSETILGIQWIK